jgi:quercetin dioxygenase-like cupin family protein/pimeloyl-ACP methyl ester carboxylesterase
VLDWPVGLVAQSILDIPAAQPGVHIAYGAINFSSANCICPHPLAIVVHGGYWRARYDLRHIGHFCVALAKAEIATWSLEYRRLGNAGGGFPGPLEDVPAGAVDLQRIAAERNLDLRRVVGTGHSAGGQLVLWLAKQQTVALRGVVPLAPVADLRRAWELRLSSDLVAEFLGGSPGRVDRYWAASPIEMVPLGVKQRVIHGDRDDVVPLSISREYVMAARKSGDEATLTEVEGTGHFELIDPRTAAWGRVRDTIEKTLMKFLTWDTVELETMSDVISRKVISGEKAMVAQVFLKKDAVVPEHQHESEQITYIMEGALKFELEGREVVVRKGEVLHIPSNVPHRAVALEDTLDLDIFSPIRVDWLTKNDAYLRRGETED